MAQSRREKREQAAARKAATGCLASQRSPGEPKGELTPAQRLAILNAKGYRATKERARLMAMLREKAA